MRVPACARRCWLPDFDNRIALDPGENSGQAHGDIHDTDGHPNEDPGIAICYTQERNGEGCLAQHGREDGEGATEVAD